MGQFTAQTRIGNGGCIAPATGGYGDAAYRVINSTLAVRYISFAAVSRGRGNCTVACKSRHRRCRAVSHVYNRPCAIAFREPHMNPGKFPRRIIRIHRVSRGRRGIVIHPAHKINIAAGDLGVGSVL